MSQRALAEILGVTFQQVQKYERGANRIAVTTLVRAAEALQTPLGFFLEGFGPGGSESKLKAHQSFHARSTDALEKVADRKLRAALRLLIRALTQKDS